MPTPSAVRRQQGFTLIELLIVFAIIGMLATFAVVAQSGTQAKRRDVKRITDNRGLQQALALYLAKVQTYPVYTGCINGTDPITTALRTNGFLGSTSTQVDPVNPSDTSKCYFYDGNGSAYTLRYTTEATSSVGPAGTYTITP